MEKILFISDLDGTLLNNNGKLSEYTVAMLNSMTSVGMYFTFATARTIYSAKPLTERLDINVPCILNNGASVYDIQSDKYVHNAYIPQDVSGKIVSAFRDNGVNCFLFKFVDGVLSTFYDNITEKLMLTYVAERKGKFAQPFFECGDLFYEIDGSEIYINSSGSYESLLPVKNAVMAIDGADCAFYKDTYTDNWFLETFSCRASKANGIKFLREKYGFTKVVAFGDNLNDLSMFSQADVKIAVGNAKPELREKADFIADTNENNGVVNWIIENYRYYFNKFSYKNVYGTEKWHNSLESVMYLEDEKYFSEASTHELPDGYSVHVATYIKEINEQRTALSKDTIKKSDEIIYEYYYESFHLKPFTDFIYHSNGHRYWAFKVSLYGISCLDVDTLEVYNYIPEGYEHEEERMCGESFIVADVHYDKESNLIAYGGCYWGGNYEIMVGDFSNPLDFNPHLVSIIDIVDPDGDLAYEDYDFYFKEWKNGRLYVRCEKTEKSISIEELKDMINKLTDKGED